MKKFEILRYLKRFSILIFLVSLAGAAAIYLYADGKQQYTASVIIRYTNDGISDGYTPDGSDLDVNEISKQLFVLDKAYVKYKSQNYITFAYGSSSFIQRLSPKKTLMESVAVMLGGAWLLHERKRRKVRHHK